MMTKAEAQELAEHVSEALKCLTDKAGAYSVDGLSEAEARLTRARAITSELATSLTHRIEDSPEKQAYVSGMLHAVLAPQNARMTDGVLSVSCQQGDLVIHPFALSGQAYRVRLERLPDEEPF